MSLLNKKLLVQSLFHVEQAQSVETFVNQLAVEIAAGAVTSAVQVTVSTVALDVIPAFTTVTVLGNRANSSSGAHYGKVIGVAKAAIAIGFAGDIVVEGVITNASWSWTPGAVVFLNGTSLSQTAPSTGFSQEIGIAKASDTLYVDVSVPILL